jgi:hypothetical protein
MNIKELNDAEEAVTKFAESTGLSEKEVVEVFVDGLAMFYKGKLPNRLYDLIDELRATFDAY